MPPRWRRSVGQACHGEELPANLVFQLERSSRLAKNKNLKGFRCVRCANRRTPLQPRTKLNCISYQLVWRTIVNGFPDLLCLTRSRSAGEAEVSSAGEQLAEE